MIFCKKIHGSPALVKIFSALSVFLLLLGCATVGPDYRRPSLPTPPEWRNKVQTDNEVRETDPRHLAGWWTLFQDPKLKDLMDRAVQGNLDLKKAEARVREARARRYASAAGWYPSLDASGTASRSRGSQETGTGKTVDLFRVEFDALWEWDLFGGTRRSVEAAEATLQAAQEAQRDVLVSLLAEVALNYWELRTYQTRLATAEKTLASQKETHQLTLWRHEAGLLDALAVEQSRYALESIMAQIPPLRTGREGALNRLAVLLGEHPGTLHEELKPFQAVPVPPLMLAVGVPADLLRRRPDIRKAERELAAQTARIGAAEADRYPKWKWSGSIGLEAMDLARLGFWGSRTILGGLGISWPIFHAGAIRQNIEIQTALQEQAFLTYQASVLKALEEVENALKSYAEEQERYKALLETTAAAERVVEWTRQKFEAGLTDFGQVLEAQRTYRSFLDQADISRGNLCAVLVRLYKALGGGWESWAMEKKE